MRKLTLGQDTRPLSAMNAQCTVQCSTATMASTQITTDSCMEPLFLLHLDSKPGDREGTAGSNPLKVVAWDIAMGTPSSSCQVLPVWPGCTSGNRLHVCSVLDTLTLYMHASMQTPSRMPLPMQEGEDVTHNVQAGALQGVPLQLPAASAGLVEVRGEVYMTDADFDKVRAHVLYVGPHQRAPFMFRLLHGSTVTPKLCTTDRCVPLGV